MRVLMWLLVACCAIAVGVWFVGVKLNAIDRRIERLNLQVGTLPGQSTSSGGASVALNAVEARLDRLGDQVAKLREGLVVSASDDPAPERPPGVYTTIEEISIRTLDQAQRFISGIGADASAQTIADRLSELDLWPIRPEDEAKVRELKLGVAAQLRKRVNLEVTILQREALRAPSGAQAAKNHAEAGRVLALYPISDDQPVLDEARSLSAQQAEVASRIDVIRRQRYNRWATERIEAAITGYNESSSYWSPKKENARLIASMVKELGEIDPALIEPTVLELYNYVLDLTKGSISEQDKIELAKQLTDPSIRRKTLGEF